MLQPARHAVISVALLLASLAHASPTDSPADANHFLERRELFSQIDKVRQTVTDTATDLVDHAMGLLGVPYKRGGSSVETGFDCSGFVKTLFEDTIGLILPRKAEQQAAATQRINKNELQPGDLVFFNTMRRAFSHVGIYIGEGKFIHSPRPGAEVRVDSLAQSYWHRRFDGARRVPSMASGNVNPADKALHPQ